MRVPQRDAAKRPGGAECKAHRGITEGNSLWANVLLFVTLTTTKKHTMSENPRLTDIPTTWEEYQQQKAVFSIEGSTMSPHHAVVAAHFDDQDAYRVSPHNQVTRNKPMFRLDNNVECSNVILTLIGTDAIFSSGGFNKHLEEEERAARKGFALPFDKTFDESGHQYTVSRHWTYATTQAVLEAACEVMQDAKLCATELNSSHASPLLDYIEQRKPGVPRIAVRVMAEMAGALGERLVRALEELLKQKSAYAELIIETGVEIPIDGDFYTLFQTDGGYCYINQDGTKYKPF